MFEYVCCYYAEGVSGSCSVWADNKREAEEECQRQHPTMWIESITLVPVEAPC